MWNLLYAIVDSFLGLSPRTKIASIDVFRNLPSFFVEVRKLWVGSGSPGTELSALPIYLPSIVSRQRLPLSLWYSTSTVTVSIPFKILYYYANAMYHTVLNIVSKIGV